MLHKAKSCYRTEDEVPRIQKKHPTQTGLILHIKCESKITFSQYRKKS